MKKRISLDIDSTDWWKVWSIVDRLEECGYKPKVWRTRKGYHVVARIYEPIGFFDMIKLRYEFGDDENRIDKDINRFGMGHPIDFLFQVRRGKDNRFRYKFPSTTDF